MTGPAAADSSNGGVKLLKSPPAVQAVPHQPDGTVDTRLLPPQKLHTILLSGILLLGVVAALYLAQAVILPAVLAIVLKLLLQPLMRYADRLGIPRVLSAFALTAVFVTFITIALTVLSGTAGTWFSHLPQGVTRLEQKLQFLHGVADMLRNIDAMIDRLLNGNMRADPSNAAPSYHLSFPGTLLAGTGIVIDISFSTVLLLFFLLAAGDTFLRKLVEVLPSFREKRQAVDICIQIERDIGYYLITVSTMNLCIGLAAAVGMYLCGLSDPLLWGVLAFALNYIPILGPLTGILLFVLVGFMSFDDLWPACLPGLVYLGIHVIEGEILTPHLIARRLTLNPPLVIMSLIFWYWLWGVPGAFLAVPLLAITRIVCSRFPGLSAFGHFLGGAMEPKDAGNGPTTI
jgi:predicted PurR-regulated permease PerM